LTPRRELTSLDELAALVSSSSRDLYVRFTREPGRDDESVDHESGLRMPGVSVNPLRPPSWWQGPPLTDWLARQIRAYEHLKEEDEQRRCWIVRGAVVERGPDNEPLLGDVETVGVVSDELLADCATRKGGSPRDEDRPRADGSAPWHSGR
jgi:hypothetical protein